MSESSILKLATDDGVVAAMFEQIRVKIPHTLRHSEQVARYATDLAYAARLDSRQIAAIHTSALLHDIGKVGVSNDILVKTDDLTAEELHRVRLHSQIGEEILNRFRQFDAEALAVRHHHERWDASGYPDGLGGENIPLAARMIHLADAIDAMLQPRPYKAAYSLDWVLGEISRCRGSQFDPNLVDLALRWARDGGLKQPVIAKAA